MLHGNDDSRTHRYVHLWSARQHARGKVVDEHVCRDHRPETLSQWKQLQQQRQRGIAVWDAHCADEVEWKTADQPRTRHCFRRKMHGWCVAKVSAP